MFGWLKKLFNPEMAEIINKSLQPEFNLHFENNKQKETPDFDKMTKKELEVWAKKFLNLNIDRRRKKDYIIDQIQKQLNKEN